MKAILQATTPRSKKDLRALSASANGCRSSSQTSPTPHCPWRPCSPRGEPGSGRAPNRALSKPPSACLNGPWSCAALNRGGGITCRPTRPNRGWKPSSTNWTTKALEGLYHTRPPSFPPQRLNITPMSRSASQLFGPSGSTNRCWRTVALFSARITPPSSGSIESRTNGGSCRGGPCS
jgi:hypothetical protein